MNFGEDITKKFLFDNNLKNIVRSHTLVMEGYELSHSGKVHTVFSAPNYCGRCENFGSIIEFDEAMNCFV